jgi:hypothetical protein
MWVEECTETGDENEGSAEGILQENIAHVEEAAVLCGCSNDEYLDVGKLSNSLDLFICICN